ncbi:Anti-sigma regulatory factor (Ser/Thr protein kinase) (plasmid) [Halanaeroarchaeum sp. HSR-CO]|uniref:SpoIIE family protein phosphatase n=1 Tax=Halanaeroarchaeum sp. HSR-CO TaxID=2866382 RepID=UPI00217DD544|nr:SpoIIE family protein phosphatase [Halanaeroarchaeum sp. HSR-CO]UWG49165.1 Anti-sigma regulatory factor (Ser/Thr protein kinase) [Halanaeroarchaeum sp. HSR-CO]
MKPGSTPDNEPTTVEDHEIPKQIPVSIGAATRPISEGEPNGDSYICITWNDTTLVGVMDGLGHGLPANQASTAARDYVESHVECSLESIFRGTDSACSGTRGVVMALAKFDWSAETISFAHVGNINVKVAGPEWTGFIVRRGVIGGNYPGAKVVTRDWDLSHTFVLYSDGVSTGWEWQDIREGEQETASTIANRLLNEYGKSDDDATVLVVTNQ